MALFATHIQFALDLKEIMKVKDLSAFLSGTVYPDSRYVTGIVREKTHNDELFNPSFYQQNDFKKGWALHFMCDHFQHDAFFSVFPDEFKQLPVIMGSPEWYAKTALKVLQDIALFDPAVQSLYIEQLQAYDQPNGEDKSQLEDFYITVQSLYAGGEISMQKYMSFFKKIGANDDILALLGQKITELQSRTSIVTMRSMYSQMLEDTRSLLLQK